MLYSRHGSVRVLVGLVVLCACRRPRADEGPRAQVLVPAPAPTGASTSTVGQLVRAVADGRESDRDAAARIRRSSAEGARRFMVARPIGQRVPLVDLGELIFLSEAKLGSPSAPESIGLLIRHVAELETERRQAVGRTLAGMLSDRRRLPGGGRGDQRVRDVAFVGLLELLATGGPDRRAGQRFLALPRARREAEIARATRQPAWVACATAPEPLGPETPTPSPDVVAVGASSDAAAIDGLLASQQRDEIVARRIREQASAAPRALIVLRRGADAALAAAAQTILGRLGVLALSPLVWAGSPDPALAATYTADLVSAELELRTAGEKLLLGYLDDTRLEAESTPRGGREPEEHAVPRRVCDDAYLALRAMSLFGSPERYDRGFLEIGPQLRDRLIAEGKRTHRWRQATAAEQRASDAEEERAAAAGSRAKKSTDQDIVPSRR